jgi:hypothetical protein
MKWRCIDKMPIPLEKRLSKKQQIKLILDDVTALGLTLEREEDKIVLRSIYWKIRALN